ALRAFILLLLPLFSFSEVIRIDNETQKKLGIKLWEVRLQEVEEEMRLPAQVSEYSDLVSQVYSPVAGIVRKIFVKQGDYVNRGKVLASVYSPQVADLQAQIRMVQVRLKVAEETLKREDMLYKEEVIPYARYYGAKIEYEKAKGEYQALLQSLRSFGEVKGDEVLIRSPIRGYVIEQKVFTGSGVDVSKEMFKVHSHEKLWVYSYARPEEVGRVWKGMKGYILWKDQRVWGYVDYISHEVDPNTKRVPVRLLVDNRKDLLRPGLMVDIFLWIGSVEGFWIPTQGVQKVKGGHIVFVKTNDGFETRKVKKVKEEKDMVLVSGNFKEKERVAVSGVIFLKNQIER
ncbi:MAG: efflux RND transporter periplasmic adaptor subunit, partial [Aquificaceae bacterium]